MRFRIKEEKGFLMYIGLIFAVAIILFLAYYLFNTYYKKPSFEESIQESLSTQGIDSSNYRSVVDSTRKKVDDIERQMLEYEKQLGEIK